jgi:hypothetical protein
MKRIRLDIGLRALVAANFVVVALLAGAMVADWLGIIAPRGKTQEDTASPRPSIELMAMGLAHIPTSDDCLLCHDEGGKGGVKPIPAVGHQLEGWTACLTCHTNEDLGRKAPGHEGIAQTECLNCHKEAQPGPAITQAHAQLDKPCLDCHGNVAHLPSSMVGRNEDDCWLCHKPKASPPPQKPHPTNHNLSCRACHRASNVGGLPITHALYDDSTCVLCHEMTVFAGASPTPAASPTASGTAP